MNRTELVRAERGSTGDTTESKLLLDRKCSNFEVSTLPPCGEERGDNSV